MKRLAGIYECNSSVTTENGAISPLEWLAQVIEGKPLQERPEGKKRAVTVSEYYYLTGIKMPIVMDFIKALKREYKDMTKEGKTKLGRREFTYLISAAPAEKFYSIRICTATGKNVVICNSECYIRNADCDPAGAAAAIREIWAEYPQPAMTVAGIAEHEYSEFLKAEGCYFDFRDERKINIDLYDCTLADYAYNGYFGGWCYNAAGDGASVGAGIRLDVHSLYPWVMSQGIPADRYADIVSDSWQFDAWKDAPDRGYMVHFSCMFHVKHNAYPFISYRNGQLIQHNACSSTFEYSGKEKDREIELYMVKPEFEAFLKLYDVKNFQFIDAVFFPVVRVAKPYIAYKYKEKQALKGQGCRYVVAKVVLNGISGQFARKKELADMYISDDMQEEIFYNEIKKPSHVLIAAWITGTARARMASLAAENYGRFLYCDTDSLHLSGVDIPTNVTVSENLGDFALEQTFDGGIYWGEKKYAEWGEYDAKLVCAGLPQYFIEAIQDRLAPQKEQTRPLPLSLQLLYDDVAAEIRSGERRVMIPYKLPGTGWQLYRTTKDKYARIKDDARRAYYLLDRARACAKDITDAENSFWGKYL